MKTRLVLPVLLAVLPLTSSADAYKKAQTLEQRIPKKIQAESIHPVWSADASILYFQRGEDICQVETAAGEIRPSNVLQASSQFFKSSNPTIQRFTVDKNHGFIALITAGTEAKTLRISNKSAEIVSPEANPFYLDPTSTPETSGGKRSGGSTVLCFVNNTEKTIDIEWVKPDGNPKKYATLPSGQTYVQHTYAGHVFLAGNLAFTAAKQASVAYLNAQPKPLRSVKKEAAHQVLFKQNNLFVKNTPTGKTIQLTADGSKDWNYCGPVHWSPDGRYLIAMREKRGTGRRIDLIKAMPSDRLQPRTESVSYPKPGDKINVRTPCLFDLETAREIKIDPSLFPSPWRLSHFHFSPESDRFFMVYNERGHQTLRLIAVEISTGKTVTVIEETSPTFIDYSSKLYLHYLDKTDEAVWTSERSGWNHLYLINRKTGAAKPITSGKWVVRGVDHVDAEKRQIWFRAGGMYPEQDPYYIHHARINFDGTGLTLLTEADGTHELQFSPNREYYIDTWSRVDQPPIHALHRSSDGKKTADLGRADPAGLLAVHPHLPEPFSAKGRDGTTEIFGVIYRPSTFDPQKKYPVIESIYAGPHGQSVPKNFSPFRGQQKLAELGFIVVQIDGMGTNWRSKKFHDVCWKNLKDAGFPDRIAWMRAAAAKYPWMDLSRVGIYGGSAGGQNAMRAVLDHADFYTAAAADCGCHDNRMDKVWWNEAWMGWPVDESYEKSSNVVDAHKLDGQLLLTVGMLDRNVDPSSTMQVVEALIAADKDFEFIPFPSRGHGAGGSAYGRRRRAEFFIKHLRPAPE